MDRLASISDTVSRLVELRIHEAERRSAVATTRLLLVTTAVVYPFWWVLVRWLVPDFVDSLPERLGVGALALTAALVTYTPRGERLARQIGEAVSYLVVLHFFTLVVRNHANVWASYGLLIILAGSNFSQLGVAATLRLTAWVGLLTVGSLAWLGPTDDALAMLGGAVAVQLMAGLGAWRRERADADRAAQSRYALRLFDQMLRALPEPVFLKDAKGTILLVNPATGSAFGMASATMSGKTLVELIGPEAAAPMLALDAAVLADGQERTVLQTLPDRNEGTKTWRLTLSKLSRGDQEPFILGIASDLTELVRQDEALRKAKDAAEAGLRAKSEFLAKMSHEIRTPMNGVLLAIEVAKSLGHGGRLAELLEIAEASAQGLLRIVNDVLDVSKMEAGELRLEQTDFDLHALLASLERAHALQAEQEQLQWQVSVDRGVPQWLVGDGMRLRQVLGNLVSNALKFTEHGYVLLRVSPLPSDDPATTRLQFQVVDSGVGIAADRQGAVLEPFVQADDSTTRRYGGTGLGLPIVRQLLERMGSDLTLHSQPGLGSSFQFVLALPLGQPQQTPANQPTRRQSAVATALPADQTVARYRDAQPHVLVVDDNQVNLAMLVALLERLDVAAHAESRGQQAVEWALAHQPLAVLMDVQMPELDGLQASAMLRAQGYAGAIIAVTAQALPGDRERCLQAGMSHYLAKPVTGAELLQVLRDAGVVPKAGSVELQASGVAGREARLSVVHAVGDRDLAARLIGLFASEWPRLRSALHDASSRSQWAQLLHRLRGTLLHLGAMELAAAAADLEQDLATGTSGQEAARQLHDLTVQIDIALQRWRDELDLNAFVPAK